MNIVLDSFPSFQTIWYLYTTVYFCQLCGLSHLHPFPRRRLQLDQPRTGEWKLESADTRLSDGTDKLGVAVWISCCCRKYMCDGIDHRFRRIWSVWFGFISDVQNRLDVTCPRWDRTCICLNNKCTKSGKCYLTGLKLSVCQSRRWTYFLTCL